MKIVFVIILLIITVIISSALVSLLFLRPFIPTILVKESGGYRFEREPDLLTKNFSQNVKEILINNNEFFFSLGQIVFINIKLYNDQQLMYKYSQEAAKEQLFFYRNIR